MSPALAGADFGAGNVAVVDRGREARNWFAHEAADCIEIPAEALKGDVERIRVLYSRVTALCAAAAIVAIGSYEICERERAPESYVTGYKDQLQHWIFEPMIDWIGWLATAPS